jgi:acyl-coenzyme A thioesterase PaaI-like protein
MGLSLQTLMPPGVSFSTIEIKVNFLKAVRAGDGDLMARGRVTKRGSRVSFAEAEARDPAGSLVGTATSSLLLHDPSPAARSRSPGDAAGTHDAPSRTGQPPSASA